MTSSLRALSISQATKSEIAEGLWSPCRPKTNRAGALDAYFDFYLKRCHRFCREGGIHVCIDTHQSVIDVAGLLLQDQSRAAIVAGLAQQWQAASCVGAGPDAPMPSGLLENAKPESNASTANTTVDMCAGLLLMAEVGGHRLTVSGLNPLPWGAKQTLREAVDRHFQVEKKLQPEDPRLGRLFNGRNLAKIGGIRISWTDNIVDHLLLVDDDQAVLIFHHISFLKHHAS